MKKLFFLIVVSISILLPGIVMAKDVKLLKKSDIKSYLSQISMKKGGECHVDEITGIHQKDKTAKIYYKVTCNSYTSVTGKIISYKSRGKEPRQSLLSTQILLLNSGKWYDPGYNIFVEK